MARAVEEAFKRAKINKANGNNTLYDFMMTGERNFDSKLTPHGRQSAEQDEF